MPSQQQVKLELQTVPLYEGPETKNVSGGVSSSIVVKVKSSEMLS